MLTRFVQEITLTGVGTGNVSVPVPISIVTIIVSIIIPHPLSLVTIDELGLTDVPGPLLRALSVNRIIPAGGNMDLLVRLTTGTADIDGVILGWRP